MTPTAPTGASSSRSARPGAFSSHISSSNWAHENRPCSTGWVTTIDERLAWLAEMTSEDTAAAMRAFLSPLLRQTSADTVCILLVFQPTSSAFHGSTYVLLPSCAFGLCGSSLTRFSLNSFSSPLHSPIFPPSPRPSPYRSVELSMTRNSSSKSIRLETTTRTTQRSPGWRTGPSRRALRWAMGSARTRSRRRGVCCISYVRSAQARNREGMGKENRKSEGKSEGNEVVRSSICHSCSESASLQSSTAYSSPASNLHLCVVSRRCSPTRKRRFLSLFFLPLASASLLLLPDLTTALSNPPSPPYRSPCTPTPPLSSSPPSTMSYSGKTAIVTGGASGPFFPSRAS